MTLKHTDFSDAMAPQTQFTTPCSIRCSRELVDYITLQITYFGDPRSGLCSLGKTLTALTLPLPLPSSLLGMEAYPGMSP